MRFVSALVDVFAARFVWYLADTDIETSKYERLISSVLNMCAWEPL